MGRYEVDDIHVVFGSPTRGHRLHRIAPEPLYLSSTRTMCGLVVVRGVDRTGKVDEFDPPKDGTVRLCQPCEEIKELCTLIDTAETATQERLIAEATERTKQASTERSQTLRRHPGSGGQRRHAPVIEETAE